MQFAQVWPLRWGLRALIVAALMLTSFAVAGAQSDTARLRVIHASPDAPAVDIWVNGEVAIANLAFPDGTDYVELPAGEYQVQVTPAGAEEPVVIDATLPLQAGTDYTVAAVGVLESIEALVLTDNNAAPAAGQAHIRVVHASPDAPAVDVAVAGGDVLISNLEFGQASEYLPVPAGSYDLQVRVAGTEDVAIDIPGFVAEAGAIYSVFAVGLLADGSLMAEAFLDAKYDQATGGGTPNTPNMPATGAGGMANDGPSSSMWWLLAAGALGGLALVAGGRLLPLGRKA